MTVYARIIRRHTLHKGITSAVTLGIALLLLRYPDAVHNGVSRGMAVCGSVIIPTLFPFMLLGGWLADSPLCRQPGRVAQGIARRLFGLPGCCATAILLSLVGGYPAGAVAIGRLHEQGLIDREQARRMAAFCVCGGPGFIVGTVGIGLLDSAHAGWLLYAAQAVTTIAIGTWLGRGHRVQVSPAISLISPRSIGGMVADTCRSLLTMCGFVVAAATVLSLLEGIGLAGWLATHLGISVAAVSGSVAALLEVSCGCIALAGMPLAPLWLSLCLGWGGLSIHGQLAAALPGLAAIDRRFRWWRVMQGTLSGGVAMVLFHLFPPERSTGANSVQSLPFSVSATASSMLLFLCFLTMLCFSEKKTGKTA